MDVETALFDYYFTSYNKYNKHVNKSTLKSKIYYNCHNYLNNYRKVQFQSDLYNY